MSEDYGSSPQLMEQLLSRQVGGLHLDDDWLHLHVAVPHCRLTSLCTLCTLAENLGGIWVSFQRSAPCQLVSIISSACSSLQTLHILYHACCLRCVAGPIRALDTA